MQVLRYNSANFNQESNQYLHNPNINFAGKSEIIEHFDAIIEDLKCPQELHMRDLSLLVLTKMGEVLSALKERSARSVSVTSSVLQKAVNMINNIKNEIYMINR